MHLAGGVAKRVGDGSSRRDRPEPELPGRCRSYSLDPVGMDRAGVELVQPGLGIDDALVQLLVQPELDRVVVRLGQPGLAVQLAMGMTGVAVPLALDDVDARARPGVSVLGA